MIGKLPFHDLFSAPMIRLQHPSAQHIVLHSACVIYWTPYEQVGDVDQSSLHYTGLSLVFFFFATVHCIIFGYKFLRNDCRRLESKIAVSDVFLFVLQRSP